MPQIKNGANGAVRGVIAGLAITVAVGLVIGGAILAGRGNGGAQSVTAETGYGDSAAAVSGANTVTAPAARVEIVHFHGTQQCNSCKMVGFYAEKTVREDFPDEFRDGRLVFRSVNGDLPENRDIVVRYQAGGSSLFVNAVSADGQERIEEDTTVWRLISNESQFREYFRNRLKLLLRGK